MVADKTAQAKTWMNRFEPAATTESRKTEPIILITAFKNFLSKTFRRRKSHNRAALLLAKNDFLVITSAKF